MKSLLTALCLATAALTFTGCTKDQPAPKYTKAWLHEADGDVLTFRNASTGATESLRATVEDVTNTITPKFGLRRFDRQTITLTYAGQQDARAGLEVVLDGLGQVRFHPPLGGYWQEATLDTDRKSSKESLWATDNVSARLETDLELNGRRHARLAHAEFDFSPAQQQNPQTLHTLREFWYAKDAGLVAYTKTDGQTWYRVW